jgi:hypothetical protein
MDHQAKLNTILEWKRQTNTKFDDSVFVGMMNRYNETGRFTERQKTAIESVFTKWNLESWIKNRNSWVAYKHKVNTILEHSEFRNSVVFIGIKKYYDETGRFTPKQMVAIDNVYEGWDM